MITIAQIKAIAARVEHAISEDVQKFVAAVEAEWNQLEAEVAHLKAHGYTVTPPAETAAAAPAAAAGDSPQP